MKSNFLRSAAFAAIVTSSTGCEEPTTRPVEAPRPTQEQLREECADRITAAVSQNANRNLSGSSQLTRELTSAVIKNVCDGEESGLVIDVDGDGYVGRVDCDDTNAVINPGAEELCDEIDNNCDGLIDNVVGGGPSQTFYRDVDGDGFVAEGAESVEACVAPEGFITPPYSDTPRDCNDNNPEINPRAKDYPEEGIIDGIDQDCDGFEDSAFTSPLPEGVEINFPGATLGGLVDSTIGSYNLINGGLNANIYLDRSQELLQQIEALIYNDNALTRAIIEPTINAQITVYLALNGEDRENVDNLLINLRVMLDYVRTADVQAEQAYFDSLEDKDNFIWFSQDDVDRQEDNIDETRQYEAMVFRRLRAGADRDLIIWGLERAISEIEESRSVTRITETEGSNDTTVTE